jgi:hypothetical protein
LTQQMKLTLAGLVLIIVVAFSLLIGTGALHLFAGGDPVPPSLHSIIHLAGGDPPPITH